MCGIVGIVHKDRSSVPLSLLSHMIEPISHRGPDDEGRHAEGGVAFQHKRLAVIDPVHGRQPMTREGVTLAFNGAIYNYRELRETLERKGRSFATRSDTEVLLVAYLEFGPDCLRHLIGMFAFLIYDSRQGRIFAARDRFGIKPLYTFENDRVLLFASEIKALLRHPDVPAEPEYAAIQDYFIFQYVLNGETLFKDIHKIKPGHYRLIEIESGKQRDVCYWQPDFRLDGHHTEEYFTGRLRELLEESIRLQLRSDVPLGTFLSGGLDSSLVTTLAARMHDGGLKTFTGAFREGPEFDETAYAHEVAQACGAEEFRTYPTEDEFIEHLPRLVEMMDEPAAGPGLFPQYMVSRLAAQHVKVVLGGQGGDEIFGGYARYVAAYLEQALKGAIFETNVEDEHIVSLGSILPNLPALKQYTPLLCDFWREGLFDSMDRRYFRIINRSRGGLGFLSPDFRSRFDLELTFGRFQELFNHPDTLSYYNKMVHFDLTASLPALLQVEDRVTMAAGLESRVPLLDHRIVELVASMAPAMKFKGAEMKYILKRVAKDIVPPSILARKDKMGFPVPLHIWSKGRLRDFLRDILLAPACRERGLFQPEVVESMIERETAFDRRLWGVLNLELWFRRFIDRG